MDRKDFTSKEVLDTVAGVQPPSAPVVDAPSLTNGVGDSMPAPSFDAAPANPVAAQSVPPKPYVPVKPPNAVVNKSPHGRRNMIVAAIVSGLFFAALGLLVGWFLRNGEVDDLQGDVNRLQQNIDQNEATEGLGNESDEKSTKEDILDEATEDDEDDKVADSDTEGDEDDQPAELEVLILSDSTRVTYEESEDSDRIDIDRMTVIDADAEFYNYGVQSRTVTNHMKSKGTVQSCNTAGSFGYYDFFEAEERLQSNGVPNGYDSVVEINELAEDSNSLLRRIGDNLYVRFIGASPPCYIELITDPENETNEEDIVKLVPGLEFDPVADAQVVLSTFTVIE